MVWIKRRNDPVNQTEWMVWHKSFSDQQHVYLNDINAKQTGSASIFTNMTSYTDEYAFYPGTSDSVGGNTIEYISYAFASLAGVSKIDSYVGTGATHNIDCGFTSGIRWLHLESYWWSRIQHAKQHLHLLRNSSIRNYLCIN